MGLQRLFIGKCAHGVTCDMMGAGRALSCLPDALRRRLYCALHSYKEKYVAMVGMARGPMESVGFSRNLLERTAQTRRRVLYVIDVL